MARAALAARRAALGQLASDGCATEPELAALCRALQAVLASCCREGSGGSLSGAACRRGRLLAVEAVGNGGPGWSVTTERERVRLTGTA